MVTVSFLVAVLTVTFLGQILHLVGATGEAYEMARRYVQVTAFATPVLAAGMGFSALLRSVGDARRAMNVTLFAALAAAALDPLLIFGCHMGLMGAAVSTLLSRSLLTYVGWSGACRRHRLVGRIEIPALQGDLRMIARVAGPAVLSNLAAPVGAAYVTHTMASFGTAAVSGQATVDRITPVAFGLVYALTGAIGPILSQNLGAGLYDRVRRALGNSMLFVVMSVGIAWAVLASVQNELVEVFSAKGQTADMIHLFCTWTAGSFMFLGFLFVANTSFNNLGRPLLSPVFNWGRATLGTIPFVALGARWGAEGVMVGQAMGCVVFGTLAAVMSRRVASRLGITGGTGQREVPDAAVSPTSGRAAVAAIASGD